MSNFWFILCLNFFFKSVSNQEIESLAVYDNFLESINSHNQPIVHFCFNSEFYQRQKIDLLSRLKQIEYSSVKYCLLGIVNTDPSDSETNAWRHIELRETFFRESAEQRYMISDELCQKNTQNLVKFSLAFDLLCLKHQNDVKKMKILIAESFDETAASENSSFVLYNCARLNAILDKFQNLVNQGNHRLE